MFNTSYFRLIILFFLANIGQRITEANLILPNIIMSQVVWLLWINIALKYIRLLRNENI